MAIKIIFLAMMFLTSCTITMQNTMANGNPTDLVDSLPTQETTLPDLTYSPGIGI